MDIWPQFRDLTHRDMLVAQHGLAGYFFVTQSEAKNSYFENIYLQTNLLNEIYLSELNRLLDLARKDDIQCIAIKGAYLLGTLYSDYGTRKMSDIDILSNEIEVLRNYLIKSNYQQIDQTEYKITLSKMIDGNEVVFELHSRLFWDSKIIATYQNGSLSRQEHFYYLIYHLSYQHTFLRMNWFVDIFLFIKKYPEVLIGVLDLAKSRGHLNSFRITFDILNRYFGTSIETKEVKFLCLYKFNFFLSPQKYIFRYYLLKHLTKKNLFEAIKYDLLWLLKNSRKSIHEKSA